MTRGEALIRPDARRLVVDSLDDAYRVMDADPDLRKIDLVTIGCPHASLSEIQQVAEYLAGKRLATRLWVTTGEITRQRGGRAGLRAGHRGGRRRGGGRHLRGRRADAHAGREDDGDERGQDGLLRADAQRREDAVWRRGPVSGRGDNGRVAELEEVRLGDGATSLHGVMRPGRRRACTIRRRSSRYARRRSSGKRPTCSGRRRASPSATIPSPPSPACPSSGSTPRPTSPIWTTSATWACPGRYPYTRGVHPTGYRGKLWTMRMFAGFGTAEETNARFRYLLEQGQTGLSVAFDMPTLYGYDTDAPEAIGEFGKCGVAISSLADMEVLLDGIPLDQVTTSMTINSPAAIIWAMYIAAAEKRGMPRAALGGTIQNDILKEYIAQKEFLFPPAPSMRLVVDTIEFGAQEMPKWNTISISGYHIREAGSTAAQELAFTLADGFAYVEAALARGLTIDDFAPRLSFFFNAHNDFFEEIAKFRAARRIWARAMREKYGAKDPRSWMLRTHAQTSGVSLTAQQPEVNIVRVALQALAAVLGGTQSLHTNSMDEALALPSEKAVTIALRTQQVIAEESGVANTVDPLGGSFFVEALTDRMEEEAQRLLPAHRGAGRRDPRARGRLHAARDRRGRLPLPAGGRPRASGRSSA